MINRCLLNIFRTACTFTKKKRLLLLKNMLYCGHRLPNSFILLPFTPFELLFEEKIHHHLTVVASMHHHKKTPQRDYWANCLASFRD